MDCPTSPVELYAPAEIEADFKPVQGQTRPVFRRDEDAYSIFYAPNCLCVVSSADANRFETTLISPQNPSLPAATWGEELCRRADLAAMEAVKRQQEPFSPECLTLYMNNCCNLRCVYCYTDAPRQSKTRLNLDTIAAAAQLVAENCRKKNLPFYVAFHGGGEPTFYQRQVENALIRLERVAQDYGVRLIRYVATNGVMSAEKAAWLADSFDLVGLSCDGPANIQNRQRPTWAGKATAPRLERTAGILHATGRQFSIRATITPETLTHQAEIADYLCRRLAPAEIRFEPVYHGGRSTPAAGLTLYHAEQFTDHFLEAQVVAGRYNTPLTTSGSRIGTLHGPYCHVFRSVLNLTPDGVATACFKTTDIEQAERKNAVIGTMNDSGHFKIDYNRVQLLKQQLNELPPACTDCFNRYHCTGECPDLCPIDNNRQSEASAWPNGAAPELGFRCRVQKLLTRVALINAAQKLWLENVAKKAENNDGNFISPTQTSVYGTTTF